MKSQHLFLAVAGIVFAFPSALHAQPQTNIFVRHNLVSDLPGHAERLDSNLVNPWGIAESATSPFWIADNHTGVSTLYGSDGKALPLVVTIPPPTGGTGPASPTGIVFNGTTSFAVSTGNPARFIFATEDGTISGWNPAADPTHAILKVDNSAGGAVYKGLAQGNNGSADLLYATNFHNGTVDVFDTNFAPIVVPGGFSDPTVPAGYAPFGIRNIGGTLFVTYALQDTAKHDDVSGAGHGFINAFDMNGTLLHRVVSNGDLNSPWGLAMAPAMFGNLGGSLLVGNFGDGTIHSYDPVTGAETGQIMEPSGRAMMLPGLWGLQFGNGANGGNAAFLYFTAGIPGPGSVEDHGLFGSIRPAQLEEANDDQQSSNDDSQGDSQGDAHSNFHANSAARGDDGRK